MLASPDENRKKTVTTMNYSSDISVWIEGEMEVSLSDHSFTIAAEGWNISIYKQGFAEAKGLDIAKMLRNRLTEEIARIQDEARAKLEELAD